MYRMKDLHVSNLLETPSRPDMMARTSPSINTRQSILIVSSFSDSGQKEPQVGKPMRRPEFQISHDRG